MRGGAIFAQFAARSRRGGWCSGAWARVAPGAAARRVLLGLYTAHQHAHWVSALLLHDVSRHLFCFCTRLHAARTAAKSTHTPRSTASAVLAIARHHMLAACGLAAACAQRAHALHCRFMAPRAQVRTQRSSMHACAHMRATWHVTWPPVRSSVANIIAPILEAVCSLCPLLLSTKILNIRFFVCSAF